jgi:hypothetical protein
MAYRHRARYPRRSIPDKTGSARPVTARKGILKQDGGHRGGLWRPASESTPTHHAQFEANQARLAGDH